MLADLPGRDIANWLSSVDAAKSMIAAIISRFTASVSGVKAVLST